MVLIKGVEIIPKRDKVTIASNILGKWEDYNIESYQGKLLQEAFLKLKLMLKEGKSVEEEVVALKQRLQSAPATDSKVKDLWSLPVAEEPVPDVVEEKEEVAQKAHKYLEPDEEEVVVTILPEAILPEGATRYVIHAYINKKTDKQMYLSSWDDSNDWMISAVPYATSKERCEMLVAKAYKQIEEANAKSLIRSRFPADLKFEIIPVKD